MFYNCAHMSASLLHPSSVQSFVGSHWIGRSRAVSMSSTASCSMCIASPTWSSWWATPTSTETCCPSTMTITTTKPSPWPALYSDCSCRGQVSSEEVFEQIATFHPFVKSALLYCGYTNKGLVLVMNNIAQTYEKQLNMVLSFAFIC